MRHCSRPGFGRGQGCKHEGDKKSEGAHCALSLCGYVTVLGEVEAAWRLKKASRKQ